MLMGAEGNSLNQPAAIAARDDLEDLPGRDDPKGVDRNAIIANFEVDVRPGGETRTSAEPEYLPLRHEVARQHNRRTHEMAIPRGVVVAVVYLHPVAETATWIASGERDATGRGSSHRIARVDADVESRVWGTDAEFGHAEKLRDQSRRRPPQPRRNCVRGDSGRFALQWLSQAAPRKDRSLQRQQASLRNRWRRRVDGNGTSGCGLSCSNRRDLRGRLSFNVARPATVRLRARGSGGCAQRAERCKSDGENEEDRREAVISQMLEHAAVL
jgi:hypothetical protein